MPAYPNPGILREAAVALAMLVLSGTVTALTYRSSQLGALGPDSVPWRVTAVTAAAVLAWRALRSNAQPAQRVTALSAFALWQALPVSLTALTTPASPGQEPGSSVASAMASIAICLLIPLTAARAARDLLHASGRDSITAGVYASILASVVTLPGAQPFAMLAVTLTALAACTALRAAATTSPDRRRKAALKPSTILLALVALTTLAAPTLTSIARGEPPAHPTASSMAWIAASIGAGSLLSKAHRRAALATCAITGLAALLLASGTAAPSASRQVAIQTSVAEQAELVEWLAAHAAGSQVHADRHVSAALATRQGMRVRTAIGPLQSLLLGTRPGGLEEQLSRIDGQWVVLDRRSTTYPTNDYWYSPDEPPAQLSSGSPLTECVPALVQAYASMTYVVYQVDASRGQASYAGEPACQA